MTSFRAGSLTCYLVCPPINIPEFGMLSSFFLCVGDIRYRKLYFAEVGEMAQWKTVCLTSVRTGVPIPSIHTGARQMGLVAFL